MQERLVELGEVARRRRSLFRLLAGLGVVVLLMSMAVVVATVMPASASSGATAPTLAKACGTKPVTMHAYFETGFPLPISLTNEFTRQYPSVKWKIRQDQFAVITQNAPLVLSGPNPPDLMRLPQLSGLVKDHLLKNLDPYFKAYGWNRFPASQLVQLRMPASGRPRGSGLALGDGPQLQHDRRLLQQGAWPRRSG